MNGFCVRLGLTVLGTLAIGGSLSLAREAPAGAPCGERQARLLERFGDQGIDGDEDGTLTRDEIMAFFADFDGGGLGKGRGNGDRGRGMGRHARGKGLGGPRHHGQGRRGGSLLRRWEVLASETPPEHFNLDRFPDADLDGDGALSDAEWSQFAEQKRSKILSRLVRRFPGADADGDGTLDDEELAALKAEGMARRAAQILERHPEVDSDGNGEVSPDELDAFRADRKAKRQARLLDRHPEADTNGDGALSQSELESFRQNREANHRARILKHHPELDTDGDGMLSDEEAANVRGKAGRAGPRGHRHKR